MLTLSQSRGGGGADYAQPLTLPKFFVITPLINDDFINSLWNLLTFRCRSLNKRDSLRTDFECLGILYFLSFEPLLRASGPLWDFFLSFGVSWRWFGCSWSWDKFTSFLFVCLSKTFDFSLVVLKIQLSNFNVILFVDAVSLKPSVEGQFWRPTHAMQGRRNQGSRGLSPQFCHA